MFLPPIAVKKIVWILLKICPEKKKEKFKQPIISQSKLHVPEMKFVVKELQNLFLYLLLLKLKFVGKVVFNSVGSEPKLGSVRLSFGSSFLGKKLGSAWLAMPSKKLGLARLAISCKKSSVQLGLLYHLKNRVTLKNKK